MGEGQEREGEGGVIGAAGRHGHGGGGGRRVSSRGPERRRLRAGAAGAVSACHCTGSAATAKKASRFSPAIAPANTGPGAACADSLQSEWSCSR